MRKNFVAALTGAISLPAMLTGCSTLGGVKPQPVELPDPPACMAPVAIPTIEPGMDARLALARHRAALKDANGRLSCSREWYSFVRKDYAKN